MYKIDFKNPISIHFIGIGGISMSGLAEILHNAHFSISGSDAKESKITKHLEELGINVLYGQRPSNITKNIDLVVYTAAINPDNPEYMEVINQNIPMMDRAELLGQIMKNYENAIAISGTHGKTTTTSMVSQILLSAGLDPTISVGGILKAINGNIRIGNSENFVTEACEYTNSFLKFYPKMAIILNIEEDHLDFFTGIEMIRKSFKDFANRLPDDGLLIINADIDSIPYFIDDLKCKVITYGSKIEFDYYAKNISYDEMGHGSYDLYIKGEFIDRIDLSVIGEHNIYNSLSAIALAREMNITLDTIKKGLLNFIGTDRRFEYKGEIGGITIIDDYAHHPTEIEATLTAAKNYPHKTIWCVFQPHTYTRTKAFLKEFALSLSHADKIVLTDIYAARESNPHDIHSKDLLNELAKLGKDAYYFDSFNDIENFLLQQCESGDLLITMGAGDVLSIGETLLGS